VRAVVQRVARARVTPGGEIGEGLCVLLGVADSDDDVVAARLAGKVARLRIFEDGDGRFDRSLLDTGGAALVVSQFTLIADTRKGNRPSFSGTPTTMAMASSGRDGAMTAIAIRSAVNGTKPFPTPTSFTA